MSYFDAKVENKLCKMPEHEYRPIKAVNNSFCSTAISKSLAHAKYELENPTEATEATEAMGLGTATHLALLEPLSFADKFVLNELSLATKEGKAVQAANPSKTVLNRKQSVAIKAIVEAVKKHKKLSEALATMQLAEATLTWTDPATGLPCKGMVDGILKTGFMFDLKTTPDASYDSFNKAIFNNKYVNQAAFYINGVEAITGTKLDQFTFWAIEKNEGELIGINEFILYRDVINYGKNELSKIMERIAQANQTDFWPAYEMPSIVTLPKWLEG